MSHKKKQHRLNLPDLLLKYSQTRTFDYHLYTSYHIRVIDSGFTVLDCWTSGKYYVLQTNYCEQTEQSVVERGGETGWLPTDDKLENWLDNLFYAAELVGVNNV